MLPKCIKSTDVNVSYTPDTVTNLCKLVKANNLQLSALFLSSKSLEPSRDPPAQSWPALNPFCASYWCQDFCTFLGHLQIAAACNSGCVVLLILQTNHKIPACPCLRKTGLLSMHRHPCKQNWGAHVHSCLWWSNNIAVQFLIYLHRTCSHIQKENRNAVCKLFAL